MPWTNEPSDYPVMAIGITD